MGALDVGRNYGCYYRAVFYDLPRSYNESFYYYYRNLGHNAWCVPNNNLLYSGSTSPQQIFLSYKRVISSSDGGFHGIKPF